MNSEMTALTMSWFSRFAAAGAMDDDGPLAAVAERDLALRTQDGDAQAFAELVRRHQAAVFNVAYRMTGNRRDAEDVTQETFLRAYRAFYRFDPERPLAPWLKRIAVNQCLNRWESARVRLTTQAADVARPDEERVDLDRWAAPRPTPEQAVLSAEREQAVRDAIVQLPLYYRAVVELRHYQGLSYDQIAETLGRSLANVKSDLYRARKMLARLLQGKV